VIIVQRFVRHATHIKVEATSSLTVCHCSQRLCGLNESDWLYIIIARSNIHLPNLSTVLTGPPSSPKSQFGRQRKIALAWRVRRCHCKGVSYC